MDNFLKGFFGSSNHSKEEKVQALLTEARSLGEQGDLDAMITSLDRAVKLNDRCTEAYFLRGTAHSAKGDSESAISDYTNAIRLEPENSEYYSVRANSHLQLRAFDLALDDFEKALEMDGANSTLHMAKGLIFLHAHNRKVATTQLATCFAIEQYDEKQDCFDTKQSKLSHGTISLINAISQSEDFYDDENGEHVRSGKGYLAGYWAINPYKYGFLWTTKAEEALEISSNTKSALELLLENEDLGWESVAVNEDTDTHSD